MATDFSWAWLLLEIGGPLFLGLLMAYGVYQWRQRGRAAKETQERGTKAVYEQADRQSRQAGE